MGRRKKNGRIRSNKPNKPGALSEAQKLERAIEASRLWTKRLTYQEIGNRLGVSRTTAFELVAKAEKHYLDQAALNIEEGIKLAIKDLEVIEREAWIGWERSLKVAPSFGQKPIGDPRFLRNLVDIQHSKNRIRGYYAPEKVEADIAGIFRRAMERAAVLRQEGFLEAQVLLPPAKGG